MYLHVSFYLINNNCNDVLDYESYCVLQKVRLSKKEKKKKKEHSKIQH